MSNIIDLAAVREDGSPDGILETAKGSFDRCMVVGWTKGGSVQLHMSDRLSPPDVLWLAETIKHLLMDGQLTGED